MFERKKTSMEKEIFEQPKITQAIIDKYVNGENINIEVPHNIKKVKIIASGSSYHCARYGAEILNSIAKIEARAIYSSEFLLEDTIINDDNLLYVFITQSGETTDTNTAVNRVKEIGAKILSITNKENSTIYNLSDYNMLCLAGEEKSIAATKSFTSQLLCITLLALKLAQIQNINIEDDLIALKTIPSIIEQGLSLQSKIKSFAKFISKFNQIVILADGASYALAKETALKIKETSYKITNSAILGEFMHGHVAVLNNKDSVVIYVLNDTISYNTIKNLSKIKETYNPPICVIGQTTNQVKSAYNLDIDCNSPIVKTFAIATIIQLLALEIALKLNKNVDAPHGLDKVVK